MPDRLDLPRRYREQIEALLREHVPGVEVWAYGSRVNGQSHEASDLDLMLRGPDLKRISSDQLTDLTEALEQSNVPILVQIHDWARLPESFHREIEQEYVVLVEKGDQSARGRWKTVTLGDVIDLRLSSVDKKTKHNEHTVQLCNYMDVYNNSFICADMDFMTATATEREISNCSLTMGDVVITKDSEKYDDIGVPALVREDILDLVCGYHLAILRPYSQKLDGMFLFYALNVVEVQQQFHSYANGVTRFGLRKADIGLVEIPLPPLSQQRAIAHILGTLDDKIELNRCMNETLEEIARALFKSWFVDFDPVRAKMESRDPGLPKHLADLFPDCLVDSELGPIPEGWEVSEIGREVDVVGGSTPSTKEPAFWDEGNIHWATPKDLSRIQSPVLIETERKITSAGLQKISSGLLPVGTVLMSSRAPVGYLAIAQVPLAVNQGFIAMKCSERISKEYTLSWCYENMDIIKANAGGTTFQEISKRNFRPLKVIVPTTGILKVYDSIVNPLFEKITLNVHESHTLAALRNTLLPKLVSGELQVEDIFDDDER